MDPKTEDEHTTTMTGDDDQAGTPRIRPTLGRGGGPPSLAPAPRSCPDLGGSVEGSPGPSGPVEKIARGGEGLPPPSTRAKRHLAMAVGHLHRGGGRRRRWPPGSTSTTTQSNRGPPSRCSSSSPSRRTRHHAVTHPVLLTDVEIGRVTALSYLYFKLQSDTSLEQVDDVTGGTPPSQLDAQGTLEMSQAEAAAKTAALRRLGYPVPAVPAGAVIFGTFPGTPAYGVLQVGDVVTAVDGIVDPDAEALTDRLAHYHSGQTVTLTVRRGHRGPGAGAGHPEDHRGRPGWRSRQTELDLGIEPEDQVDFHYPIAVNIDVTNIGGPSAGLAMTLGVIDALSQRAR